MKKNKEWLKEQIKYEEVELKHAFDNYVSYEKVLIADDVNELVNELEEPEQDKVVIHQFVADWIEYCKKHGESISECLALFDPDYDKAFDWINTNRLLNENTVARAWLDGYSVEKEKLYRVKVDQGTNYLYVESLHLYSDVIEPLDFNYKFSTKEHALKFANRNQAKGVAELVDGEVEEVTK